MQIARPVIPQERWRRQWFRIPSTAAVAEAGSLTGRLLNTGRDGLALETSAPVQIGRTYKLKVRLGAASCWVTGTVRWCILRRVRLDRHLETVPVYHAGLHLEEVDEEGLEAVLDGLRCRMLSEAVH